MKSHTGDLSCSCTSCTFRSESDRPSVRHFIKQGSRIDRLYYGKYIPLRERKLLERLVRTRGAYDDIRAQLLSNSSIALDNKAVLKPYSKISKERSDTNDETRVILELVNRIDKGDHFETNDLTTCCSCCSCSSKMNIHNKHISKQKNLQNQHRTFRYNSSRENTVGRPYMRKGVRFKTKHVRSEPCTCTYNFSGIIKKKSKGRRMSQPLHRIDLHPTTDEEIAQKPRRIQNLPSLSFENLQQLTMEEVEKVKESKTKVQDTLNKNAKKSVNKIRDKVKVQKKLPYILNVFETSSCTCSQGDLISQVKKDSLIKFRDDLKRKNILKKYECDRECFEEICIPKECFNKLKRKHSLQSKLYNNKKDNANDIISKELMSKNITPSIKNVQNKVTEYTVPYETVKQKPLLRSKKNRFSQSVDKKKDTGKRYNYIANNDCVCKSTTSNNVIQKIKPRTNITNKQNTKKKIDPGKITINKKGKFGPPKKQTSQRQVVSIGSSFSFNVKFYKNINAPKYEKLDVNLRRPPVSSIEKNDKRFFLETRKEQKRFKQCLCSLKLKPKISKGERVKRSKKVMTSKESMRTMDVDTNTYNTNVNGKDILKTRGNNVQQSNYLLPYECEPGVCKPEKCDPFRCIKLLNKRRTKVMKRSTQSRYSKNNFRSIKNKSTTSFNLMPQKNNKFIQRTATIVNNENNNKKYQKNPNITKQTVYSALKSNDDQVRIGSSMSFNIEFYKNRSPYSTKPSNTKIHNDDVHHKNIFHRPPLKKEGLGKTLKSCFCTSKLRDKKKSNQKITKKNKKVVTDIHLIQTQIIKAFNKSTKTKNSRRLKPFECEPLACIPGQCNPYICLEKINERYNNFKEIGLITQRPERKTVSSLTYARKSLRNIQIQSKPKSIARKIYVPTNPRDSKEHSSSTLTNPSVKIGSTFSCSIEFFKTNTKFSEPLNALRSTSLSEREIKKKSKKAINDTNKKNKLNIYETTKKKAEKNVGISSKASHMVKRCFCTLNLNKYRRHRAKTNVYNKTIIPVIEYTINRASTGTAPVLLNEEYNLPGNNSEQHQLISSQKFSSSLYSVSFENFMSKTSLSKHRLFGINLQPQELTNIYQFTKNSFCTMNLQFANKISHRKPKISSVTLGSNFSFNVDISRKSILTKNKGGRHRSSTIKHFADKDLATKSKLVGPKNRIIHRNQISQSDLGNLSPVRKKCFCTLKLQKKGRWHNTQHFLASASQIDQRNVTVKYADKAQITKMRPLNIAYSLKPYECEPNICVPGYCDPYQCLEIIKRKNTKKSGVNTILPATKIGGSLTDENHASKGTQRVNRDEVKKIYSNDLSSTSNPTKQLVRVGSNISFSVEFFKEQSSPDHSHIKYNNLKSKKKIDQVETLSQNSKVSHHKQIGMKRFSKNASTMTMSFIKRCFCTAQLQKNNKNDNKNFTPTNITSPSFIEKCFCLLKFMKVPKVAKQGIHLQKIPTSLHKKTNTTNKSVIETHRNPYECEPGICIPGECDPYDCQKKIYNRNKMKNTKVSTKNKTRSMGIYSPEVNKKNVNLQSKIKYKQENKLKPSKVYLKGHDLQSVKIGSNFSFKIDFYKAVRGMSNKTQKITQQRSIPSFKNFNKKINYKKFTQSRLSQSVSTTKSDRSTNKKHFLRRCFCTLRLNSQYARSTGDSSKNKKIGQLKLSTKSVMTKIEDSENYECEPNTCVPYQCNPYECEKKIKLRKGLYRETGILTQRPRKHSVCSSTCPARKSKQTTQTLVHKNHYSKENFNINDKKSQQKVKIGSSFDFNIEFTKNQKPLDLDIGRKGKATYKINKNHFKIEKKYYDKKNIKKNTKKHTSNINKKLSSSKRKHLNVLTLKKCICTLFSKRPKKKLKHSTTETASKGKEAHNLPERKKLLPYECEPLSCIPGQCDPYACLEQIQKRNLKNVGGNTLFPNTSTTASVTLNRPNLKNKKSQCTTQYQVKKGNLKSRTNILEPTKKQSVKIGSNFNFKIEFYKNKNGAFEKFKTNSEQKIMKYNHKVGQSTKYKLINQHNNECDKSNCPELTNVHKKEKLNGRNKIKIEKDDKIKNTHTFLKRCLCVLELIRKKRKYRETKLVQNFDKKNKASYDFYKNNAIQNKLLPYECEPNFCIPEECDPYKCEKRIKSRHFDSQKRELYLSKIAATDKFQSKSIKLQASNRKLKERKQNTKSLISNTQKEKKPISEGHTGKKVVRVGSTFSFDIEFFKDNRKQDGQFSKKYYSNKDKRESVSTNKKITTDNKTVVSRGSEACKCAPDCHKYTSLERKSYNISTQVVNKCLDECVGVRDLYAKKNRSNFTDKVITMPSETIYNQNQEIVKKPRITNNLNQQAVKIGSNFNFNIEFYKKISPKIISQSSKYHDQNTRVGNGRKELKEPFSSINRKNKIKSLATQNHQSQAVIKSENKSSDVQNALKRCFCTLKLQKNVHFHQFRKNLNLTPFSKMPVYPQTFEVRRVNVSHEHKSPSKLNTSVRTVATKINKKYIKENVTSPCKCSINRNSLRTKLEDMQTILPYKPTKFKKTSSKSLLQIEPKYNLKNKMIMSKTTKNGKKLKKTKSTRNIYKEKRLFNVRNFLCRCAAVFLSKNQKSKILHNYETNKIKSVINQERQSQKLGFEPLKVSKSDRRSSLNPNLKLNRSKSLKINYRCCDECFMKYKDNNTSKNETNRSIAIDNRNHKNSGKIKSNAVFSKNFQELEEDDKNQKIRSKPGENLDQEICKHCRTVLSEKQNDLLLEDYPTAFSKKLANKKKDIKPKKLSECNKRCYSCGRQFVKEEIQKGAGDRPIDTSRNLKDKNNKSDIKYRVKMEKMPLLNMQLSTDNYDIINKKEVHDHVAKITIRERESPLKLHNIIPEKTEKTNVKVHNYDKQDKLKKSKSVKRNIPQKEDSYIKKEVLLNNFKNKNLCGICQQNVQKKLGKAKSTSPNLKVHFSDTTPKGNIKLKKYQNIKHTKKSKVSTEYHMHCTCCGQKCIKDTTIKEADDRALDMLGKKNIYQSSIDKIKEIFKLNYDSDNICSGNIKPEPLFEMHLSTDDYGIINKEQFMDNVVKYSKSNKNANKQIKSHKKTCKCCICLFKRHKTGARIEISPKRSKTSRTIAKLMNTKAQSNKTLPAKPCTCGSFVCSKNVKKMHESTKLHKRKLWRKPCICGSPICSRESAAINAVNPDKITCTCKEEYKKKKRKIKMIKNEAEAKKHASRRKLLSKEDSIRRQKRLKEDKEMEKRINKKSSDIVLLTESAIDIGKLGITAAVDILRSVARTASNPKHAYYTLKAMKDDPQLMASHLKTAFNDSGVASTARRVRLRCMAMRGVKKVKNTLEKYAISNYLLHIADSDPKKRLIKKKKPLRVREQRDFGCSLYMESLRKRPYLSVYNRCPWFYPHFLSLLNVWKQFTDISLFLLAVVVWSPCILCMEVCRAMMCCFFCTG